MNGELAKFADLFELVGMACGGGYASAAAAAAANMLADGENMA